MCEFVWDLINKLAKKANIIKMYMYFIQFCMVNYVFCCEKIFTFTGGYGIIGIGQTCLDRYVQFYKRAAKAGRQEQ